MTRSFRYFAAALGLALVVAVAATAAPRDLDRSFGGDGVVVTAIGEANARASALALQPDGRIVVAGSGQVPPGGNSGNALAVVRYLPGGRVDPSFGGGDGVVERFTEDGTGAGAVAIQPDGKILVAGSASFFTATIHVTRYLANGVRDESFGDDGVAILPGICCDGAEATGLAIQPDGKIVVAGWITNTPSMDSFVARLTSAGQPDESYDGDGVARLELGDAEFKQSRAFGLVLQGDRAVIAGEILTGEGERNVMLARLDGTGALDGTFGDGGVVQDRAGNDDDYRARDVALRNGKLVVTGFRGARNVGPRNYLIARFEAEDGALDTTFNSEGSDPGHVFASAGDGVPVAVGVAVDAAGRVTVAGSAMEDGKRKMLVARYLRSGVRDDAGFRSSDGHVGARLIDAGDSGNSEANDVVLDPNGKIVVAGWALDAGRSDFALARLGDTPARPNIRPVARIRGHHDVPRKRWVRFHGMRSSDADGRIVEYAWRTGDRPYRVLGPVFWHRFGRPGTHVVSLRVRDDRGAVDFATFRVSVRTRSATTP
ncbi:MAG TPA: PKD domain-containing protein [Thermoleophilaceae bacterium]|nr:PKD domain-containing protein [Thermoleophilaceae bacterium]